MSIRKLMNYWFQKSRDGFYIFFGILAAGLYALGTALGFYLQESVLSASFLGYVSSDRSFSRKAAGPCQRILHDGIPADLCAGLIRGPASVRSPLGMDLAWSSVSHPHLIVCTCGNGTKYLCYVKPARSASLSCGTNRSMGIFAVLLLSLLTVLVLRQIAQSIWTFFTKPRHFDDDEKIYLKPSLHLDTETAKTGFRPAIAFLPVRTPGEKIRRLYRQRILKHFSQKTAGILPRWASPSELEETCGMDQPALHELYEKARYGNVPCTREHLEQLKKSK